MKLIKLLVTMSLINAVLVIGMAQFSTKTPVPPVVVSPGPVQSISPSPTINKPIPKPTIAPTVAPITKPSGCVIQIDGVSYEITSLRKTHSGGDVFQCGTDMSALFWKKHDSQILKIMQQYKI